MNSIVATTETKEPKLDTAFHPLYASGKSGILLGIPAKPKKCWGKNVKLTPTKRVQKCIYPKKSSYNLPTIFGVQ